MSYHLQMEKTGTPPQIDGINLDQQDVGINLSQEQEQVQPEIVHQPDNQELVAAASESTNQAIETPAQQSFKQLRQKAERESDRAYRAEKELEEARRYISSIQSKPEEDNEINLGANEIVEGKHLSRVDKKIRKLEQEVNQYKAQAYAATVESRIKSSFPDFD